MEIEVDLAKSAQDNANDYFYKSKRAKRKKEGAEQSVRELEKKLEDAEQRLQKIEKKKIKVIAKREWYEKFHWFFASNAMLAVGGRDAAQNELINSRHFEEKDLFFHADIFGASVVVLKNGIDASREVKEEVAQFAACYSSAWKEGQTTVNVYSLKREQVTKSKSGGSLGTGAFAMSGEREWFKNVKLELVAFIADGRLNVVPGKTAEVTKAQGLHITLGDAKKSDAAKLISKRLGYDDIDYVMQQFPTGGFKIK